MHESHTPPRSKPATLVLLAMSLVPLILFGGYLAWLGDRDDAPVAIIAAEPAALSSLPKINAHESAWSDAEIDKIRQASARLNIHHTVLIGQFDDAFDEGQEWDRDCIEFPNNGFALDVAARYPDEFSAIVMVNPSDPRVFDKLAGYVDRGAIGVQVYDWMFPQPLDDASNHAFFASLESHRVPLYLRTSVKSRTRFAQVDGLLNRYRFLKVLIPHYMVAEDQPAHIHYLLEKHDNLYFDVSYGYRYWRHDHFRRLSLNRDRMLQIMMQFPDRILWGTDVVVSDEEWKTQDYIDRSYADYAAQLEQHRYQCSVTGTELNGLGLPAEVLKRIYTENFERFFGERVRAPQQHAEYFGQFASEAGEQSTADARLLVVAVANRFSTVEGLTCRDGRIELPPGVVEVCADERLAVSLAGLAPAIRSAPVKDVLARVQQAKDAIGLICLNDLRPDVKLLAVDGFHPLDVKARVDCGLLDRYTLALPLPAGSRPAGVPFDPYQCVTVTITGCSLIGQGLNPDRCRLLPEELAGGIRSVIRESDLTHLSLESVIRGGCRNDLQRFKFCTDVLDFPILPYLGIDLVGLTGNHLHDFGRGAFIRTLDRYDTRNIAYYGGGRDSSIDATTAVVDLFGTRIGFAGYNDVSFSRELATADRAGSLGWNASRARRQLEQLAEWCDVVFVDLQAGDEFAPEPSYHQRSMARMVLKAGADAVNFLHSHVIKGIEFPADGVVAYGLGNFLFFHPDQRNDTRNGFAIRYVIFDKRIVQVEPIPVVSSEDRCELGDGTALARRLEGSWGTRNRKHPDLTIRPLECEMPDLGPRERRFRSHFKLVPATSLAFRKVSGEQPLDVNGGPGILCIDPLTAFRAGSEHLLEQDHVYVLFSFEDMTAMEAFRDAVQGDLERHRSLFRTFADRILFGGKLFTREACDSERCHQFSAYLLLEAYRNLLERDQFEWPHWASEGSEWDYDYGQETPVRGLDLPNGALEKIYRLNYRRLSKSMSDDS